MDAANNVESAFSDDSTNTTDTVHPCSSGGILRVFCSQSHPVMTDPLNVTARSHMGVLYGMQHPGVHLKIFITPIALVYRLLATLLKKFQDAYGTI
ncbi:unnamed protein product [Acanthoscelides obtectus]|uniref:Uncharacterized protein n=1 Tax=Acanthoscelides obtectus TaxID=200917 RepID=A0A9P0M384_ACAOB|nr:unnamed protein product [Acanthoscelides obtectus]CAK1621503.1 hypothetical protein AOBTE_LOCUS997 [Acanthoscelides obtectus]